MISDFFIMVIGSLLIFACVLWLMLRRVKELCGKANVHIGVETMGVKTYMDVSFDTNAEHKEKE